MATFSYSGTNYTFPGASGIFLCSIDGAGAQSNPVLLKYRGTKHMQRYRDQVAFQALGRAKPAVELGQYNFKSVQLSFAIPPTDTDYDGVSTVTRATVESRLDAIMDNLQLGQFIKYQDSRGRVLQGTLTADFQYHDEPVGWETVEGTIVEAGV